MWKRLLLGSIAVGLLLFAMGLLWSAFHGQSAPFGDIELIPSAPAEGTPTREISAFLDRRSSSRSTMEHGRSLDATRAG